MEEIKSCCIKKTKYCKDINSPQINLCIHSSSLEEFLLLSICYNLYFSNPEVTNQINFKKL